MATDHDMDIYKQMSELLLGFRAGTMRLGDLIEELPELVKNLEAPEEAWKQEFISYWWTLEQVHGDAIELGESRRMPEEARNSVDDSVSNLDRIVAGALANA